MRALAALEAVPENPVFPAVVHCPLCHQNSLHLFDDILTDGLWLYCTGCQAHGNIITFGSVIWKTGVAETIAKFVDFGLIKEADAARQTGDCERAAEKAQAADLFWETVAGQLWDHDDDITACRLRELGVQHEIKSGEGLIGVAHADQIAALCGDLNRRKWIPLRGKNPSIVFPYYDLPGRVSGFLLFQYDNQFKEKRTFVALQHHSATADAGYFLLNNLLSPVADIFRGKQFIVEDPTWALTLQCANMAHGIKLSPVVASYGGNEIKSVGKCWPALFPATRLFQGATITPHIISQACNSRGYVCQSRLDVKRESVRKTPTYFLHRLQKIHFSAASWQTGLEAALADLSDTGAYAFATKLNIPHEKVQTFFDKRPERFSDEFRSRTLAGLKYRPTAKERIFGSTTIVARDGKLWTVTGGLVCSAQIVVSKIIQLNDTEKLYSGHIFIGDTQLDFTESANRIENQGLLSFAASYAAAQGQLVTYARPWNKRSLLALLQLKPPTVENISTHIGWDDTANVFRFGQYAIANNGDVEKTQTLLNRTKIKFPEPGIVAPELLDPFFAPTPQNSFIWAVAAALFANIVAPVLRKDPRATTISGPAFDVARKLGDAIGCDYLQTDAIHKNSANQFLKKQAAHATWPFFVASAFDDRLFSTAANRHYTSNVFVRMADSTAAISVGYGWQEIMGDSFPPLSTNFSSFCQLLPMYVQHSLRNRMRLGVPNLDLVECVVSDLHAWLQQLYGQTFNLAHVKNRIVFPHQAHEALFREINSAILAGQITVIPRPRRADQPSNYLLRRKETWWINRKSVDSLCYHSKNIVPNWLKIIDLLVDAGVFIDEEFIHKMPGIVVDGKWCDQFLTTGAGPAQKEVG